MDYKKEGSLAAPTRDLVDWNSESYTYEDDFNAEMKSQFEVCHSCRRCFNLCDSFPKLFDLIDDAPSMELDTVESSSFNQ